jgi:hypothetical protein
MNNGSAIFFDLLLLKIFCSSDCSFVTYDVTHHAPRISQYIHLTTKDAIPKSLELLALQWLCIEKSPTMLLVLQCSVCALPLCT